MKKLFLTVVISFCFVSAGYGADPGAAIFQSNYCGTCHKPDISRSNPSLKDIARAYQGKEGQLIKYLQGEAEPIIAPERSKTMKRYVEKTKVLSDQERKALADFIMGF